MIGARDPMGLVGQTLDGQYRVDEFVGEGGFSVVYRGYHTGLGEIVAIKCLKLQTQLGSALVESFVRRFRDEGRILYRLSQGNLHIVRSIASGTTIAPVTGSLVPYTVLEWLEGHSLAQDFDRRRAAGMKGRSPMETAVLFSTAFEAVAYAHEAGVVHRDLNPGNIFLTQTREGVRAKVLDFGVAKIISDHALAMGPRAATIGQIRMFSPAYAAPEQFDEKLGKPGPYTDVYTFALVFVEALRDIPAIEGENLALLISQTLDEDRRPTPRALGVEVPDALEDVFVRALAIRPEKRPKNAGQLWVEIAAALKIRNVTLPSPSPLLQTPPPGPAAVHRPAFGAQTVRMTSPLSGNGPSPSGNNAPANADRTPPMTQPMAAALASTIIAPASPTPMSEHDGRFSATMLAPENMLGSNSPARQPSAPSWGQVPQATPSGPLPSQLQPQQQQQPAYAPPIVAITRDAGPIAQANDTTGSTMLAKPGGSGKVIALVVGLLVVIGVAAFFLRSRVHLRSIAVPSASVSATTTAPTPTIPPTTVTAAPTATETPPAPTMPPAVTAMPIVTAAATEAVPTPTTTAAASATHEVAATSATAQPSAAPVNPNAFDAAAANHALATFDGILVSCTDARGQKGVAHVTFGSDGGVQKVIVDAPLGGTPGGDCVASRYKLAHTKKFEGPPANVDHPFHIAK